MHLLWFLLLAFSLAQTTTKAGHCAMYGECGKKSVFGKQLPCPSNITAPKALEEALEILDRVCGAEFSAQNGLCCSYDQLVTLELNLKRVEPMVSSCPACRKNFYDFFCKFTCLLDQATFMEITSTGEATDTHREIVTELTLYTDPKYAQDFFDSCKNIKFSATNGYAMDLIGGGATNYSQFLKFLGDEKPLLGGSPFQINFKYALPEGLDLSFSNGTMKNCDDPVYKCACSDCPSSCPTLPPFHDFLKTCHIGPLPCFSFAVMLVWLVLILLIGAYHVYLAKQKRLEIERMNSLIEGGFDCESMDEEYPELGRRLSSSSRSVKQSAWSTKWATAQENVMYLLETLATKISFSCCSNPLTTLLICATVIGIMCCGLTQLEWETSPVNLWVSPNEPALHNLQYFESHFGEWFRIEQLIISLANPGEAVMSWENVKWWFEKELELQALQHENGTYELEKLCFKPMGDTCAIESFTQYFNGDIRYLNEDTWAHDLSACAESPVTCLPSFQQPLKKNILFSQDNVLQSKAFVVTLLLDSRLEDEEYTAYATGYEKALQAWVRGLQQERPDLHIAFSTEISLEEELNQSTNTDVKVVVLSYLMMFAYASVALGGRVPTSWNKRSLVHTRFLLGLSGILFIVMSVAAAGGACAMMGIKSTLIIAEVIPFLVLAIGVDNVFLIVHEVHLVSERTTDATVEHRISQAVGKIGPSCLISAVVQVLMFLLAATVQMPAVRNFAFYSAGAVAVNFVLQMTAFVAVLALDQKRMESGRMDIAPWITVEGAVQLGQEEHVEYDFSHIIRERYAPWLFSPKTRGKVLAVFLCWTGLLLALLPRVQLGLDQRLALPADSYLVDYFDAVYEHLNVGPPVFFVMKELDVTARANQQAVCGKFGGCNEYSVANVLEQEYKRGAVSTIAEPASNWLDDFFGWLNPALDQCCRVKVAPRTVESNVLGGGSVFDADAPQFCAPHAPPRQCEACYAHASPPYDSLMAGLPTGDEFMTYFHRWIDEPSDPCPLGGKAPYSAAVDYNSSAIVASYVRTSHRPLRSQQDFIVAYKNAARIVTELKRHAPAVEVFAHLPFYVFFVQYHHIVAMATTTVAAALAIVWAVSAVLLALILVALVLTAVVACIVVNVAGVMAMWGISLNAVSLVNLVICLGLAVEFTVHLARAYVAHKHDDADAAYAQFMAPEGPRETAREPPAPESTPAFRALCTVGGAVIGGITLTKLIGIAVLAFTRSKIFEVYYFRMWLLLVVVAAAHSLVLLPVVLLML